MARTERHISTSTDTCFLIMSGAIANAAAGSQITTMSFIETSSEIPDVSNFVQPSGQMPHMTLHLCIPATVQTHVLHASICSHAQQLPVGKMARLAGHAALHGSIINGGTQKTPYCSLQHAT